MKKYVYAFCLLFFFMYHLSLAQPLCSGTPSAGTTRANDTLACSGDTVSLRLEGLTELGLMFQWQSSPDGNTYTGISGAIDSVYSTVLTESTWFRCVVTCVSSGLSSTSPELLVTVAEDPPAGGSISETHSGLSYVFTVAGLSGSFAYAWNFGDGGSSTLENGSHTYAAEGTYTVTVIVSNGCGADTLQEIFSVLSTEEIMGDNGRIKIFPNPAVNNFCLYSPKPLPVKSIRIADVSGRVHWVQEVPALLPMFFSVYQLQLIKGSYIIELIFESDEVPFFLRLLVE